MTDDRSDDGSEEDQSGEDDGKWTEMANVEPAAAAAAAPNSVPYQGGAYPDSFAFGPAL